MYLKSLEVHGFKSFANKLVFEFHDGITAIVGPNGSGKSNVGDAVRWVLGEQSAKQLRGAKMEDVIFSGTETRKPIGFAYVAITLDNSDHKLPIDYEEVTIARRVYRSGESEYLINGTSCRLRDVQELFLDTGIGKEGYSIIGQGQIDKILSGKPEDRRELFDEAAGIVKFKKRKATAERNLQEEKQNLYRINDILAEIEKQIVPLEKQSVVAKEYLKLRDELKTLDVSMFLTEYDRIHEAVKSVEEKSQIASNDLNEATKSYDSTKEEYERLEIILENNQSKLEDYNARLSESKIRTQQLEGEVKVLIEQIIAAKQNDEHYQARKQVLLSEIDEKNKELQEQIGKKQEIGEHINSLDTVQSENLQKLKEIQVQIEEYGKDIEACNAEIFEILSENSNIKAKMQRYETMLEQNNIKRAALNQKIIKNKSDEAIFEEIIEEEKQNLLEVSNKLQDFTNANEEIEKSMEAISEQVEKSNAKKNDLQMQYHREKSKLDSLKNITERYEGYGNSIRKVMEQKDNNQGIIGVVADIIKVKKEYETAVEIALGGSIQNIVTDNENTAKNLIEFLKKNKFGRATFLPLTGITNRNSFYNEKVLTEQGVIGLASSLITAEDRFKDLVEYLLGRIVVVDQIDNAILIAKKYNYSLRIVTTDGELLSPGGSMSGGAYKNSSNLLGRRREMEDLSNKVHELNELLNKEQDIINRLKQEENSKRIEREENKKSIQELYLLQNTAKMKLNTAMKNKQDNILGFSEIQKECSEIDMQSKELNQNIEDLMNQLKDNEASSLSQETKIAQINQELSIAKQSEKDQSEELAKIKMDFSNLEQKNQFILENITRINQDIEKRQDEIEGLEQNRNDYSAQIKEKEQVIDETKLNIDAFIATQKECEETIKELQLKREDVSKQHKSFFSKREELSKQMNDLDKEIFRLNNQKEKLSEQLDAQITYMWDEYEITYSVARDMNLEHSLSVSQTKKSIHDLKSAMKALGDVNVNAIEDYKNLTERYELLKTQHDDLLKAEEVLQEIIRELDNEMRKQFEEKFEAIKNQFDIVFKELFGGGKGTLELTEDEDLLEAGIRIIAQPPGKKLQNMMQLSGGEKALTAISLLFAIQNLKPSPFCLLDEIEAALDDANVKRYAKYLHKLSDETQFIVITHRRGTMAAADILYGITMQEKGVSTLVSVNLIENELDK